jgi:DNA-binding NtrC family response regulator
MALPTRKPTLLILEDDIASAELCAHWAREFDLIPILVHSAAEVQKIRWSDVTAALIDLVLPDGDGLEVLSHLRKEHPEIYCFVLTSTDSAQSAVAALKAGAIDYFVKPIEPDLVFPSIRHASQLPRHKPSTTQRPSVWSSASMKAVNQAASEAAKSDFPVLLEGEPGCGQRIMAQAIHNRSERKNHKFALIDASALDPQQMEIELFGRSNLKGGKDLPMRGKIEICQGGTLLIKNIHCMPGSLQSRLLPYLEDSAAEPNRSDVRIISSSHAGLIEDVNAGRFRKDLYYRLKSITIPLPTLSEAAEDIGLWTQQLLTEICVGLGCRRPQVTRTAMEAITEYSWPGNLDELRSALQHAMASSKNGILSAENLPPSILKKESRKLPAPMLGITSMADMEKASLIAALEGCGGNRRRAAQRLGISLRTIYNMIKRHDIP